MHTPGMQVLKLITDAPYWHREGYSEVYTRINHKYQVPVTDWTTFPMVEASTDAAVPMYPADESVFKDRDFTKYRDDLESRYCLCCDHYHDPVMNSLPETLQKLCDLVMLQEADSELGDLMDSRSSSSTTTHRRSSKKSGTAAFSSEFVIDARSSRQSTAAGASSSSSSSSSSYSSKKKASKSKRSSKSRLSDGSFSSSSKKSAGHSDSVADRLASVKDDEIRVARLAAQKQQHAAAASSSSSSSLSSKSGRGLSHSLSSSTTVAGNSSSSKSQSVAQNVSDVAHSAPSSSSSSSSGVGDVSATASRDGLSAEQAARHVMSQFATLDRSSTDSHRRVLEEARKALMPGEETKFIQIIEHEIQRMQTMEDSMGRRLKQSGAEDLLRDCDLEATTPRSMATKATDFAKMAQMDGGLVGAALHAMFPPSELSEDNFVAPSEISNRFSEVIHKKIETMESAESGGSAASGSVAPFEGFELKPLFITVSVVRDTSICLKWTEPALMTEHYEIQMRHESDTQWTLVYRGDQCSCVTSNLEPLSRYLFRGKYSCSLGDMGWSPLTAVRTISREAAEREIRNSQKSKANSSGISGTRKGNSGMGSQIGSSRKQSKVHGSNPAKKKRKMTAAEKKAAKKKAEKRERQRKKKQAKAKASEKKKKLLKERKLRLEKQASIAAAELKAVERPKTTLAAMSSSSVRDASLAGSSSGRASKQRVMLDKQVMSDVSTVPNSANSTPSQPSTPGSVSTDASGIGHSLMTKDRRKKSAVPHFKNVTVRSEAASSLKKTQKTESTTNTSSKKASKAELRRRKQARETAQLKERLRMETEKRKKAKEQARLKKEREREAARQKKKQDLEKRRKAEENRRKRENQQRQRERAAAERAKKKKQHTKSTKSQQSSSSSSSTNSRSKKKSAASVSSSVAATAAAATAAPTSSSSSALSTLIATPTAASAAKHDSGRGSSSQASSSSLNSSSVAVVAKKKDGIPIVSNGGSNGPSLSKGSKSKAATSAASSSSSSSSSSSGSTAGSSSSSSSSTLVSSSTKDNGQSGNNSSVNSSPKSQLPSSSINVKRSAVLSGGSARSSKGNVWETKKKSSHHQSKPPMHSMRGPPHSGPHRMGLGAGGPGGRSGPGSSMMPGRMVRGPHPSHAPHSHPHSHHPPFPDPLHLSDRRPNSMNDFPVYVPESRGFGRGSVTGGGPPSGPGRMGGANGPPHHPPPPIPGPSRSSSDPLGSRGGRSAYGTAPAPAQPPNKGRHMHRYQHGYDRHSFGDRRQRFNSPRIPLGYQGGGHHSPRRRDFHGHHHPPLGAHMPHGHHRSGHPHGHGPHGPPHGGPHHGLGPPPLHGPTHRGLNPSAEPFEMPMLRHPDGSVAAPHAVMVPPPYFAGPPPSSHAAGVTGGTAVGAGVGGAPAFTTNPEMPPAYANPSHSGSASLSHLTVERHLMDAAAASSFGDGDVDDDEFDPPANMVDHTMNESADDRSVLASSAMVVTPASIDDEFTEEDKFMRSSRLESDTDTGGFGSMDDGCTPEKSPAAGLRRVDTDPLNVWAGTRRDSVGTAGRVDDSVDGTVTDEFDDDMLFPLNGSSLNHHSTAEDDEFGGELPSMLGDEARIIAHEIVDFIEDDTGLYESNDTRDTQLVSSSAAVLSVDGTEDGMLVGRDDFGFIHSPPQSVSFTEEEEHSISTTVTESRMEATAARERGALSDGRHQSIDVGDYWKSSSQRFDGDDLLNDVSVRKRNSSADHGSSLLSYHHRSSSSNIAIGSANDTSDSPTDLGDFRHCLPKDLLIDMSPAMSASSAGAGSLAPDTDSVVSDYFKDEFSLSTGGGIFHQTHDAFKHRNDSDESSSWFLPPSAAASASLADAVVDSEDSKQP